MAGGSRRRSRSTSGDRRREKKKQPEVVDLDPIPPGASFEGPNKEGKDFGTGKSQEEVDVSSAYWLDKLTPQLYPLSVSQMMKMMGFSGFDSTKGKQVKGNDVGDVHKVSKRKYRQYMNRKGGFNRPLDYCH